MLRSDFQAFSLPQGAGPSTSTNCRTEQPMKTVYVVVGTNGILNTVGPVGGGISEELARQIEIRQGWKLDSSKVFPVQIAETEEELLEWIA